MRTEVDRSFNLGFVLNEQQLRRIYEMLIQQISRVTREENIITNFEIKYRNGIRGERHSLDDILSENNGGHWTISTVKIGIKSRYIGDINNFSQIHLEFNRQTYSSIIYHISGNDRDWVHGVSSQLNDRIVIIKRVHYKNWPGLIWTAGIFTGISIVLFFFFFFSFFSRLISLQFCIL